MSWIECQLGDVMTLKRGYDLPNGSRKEGEIPVVSSSGITGYHNEIKTTGPAVVTGRYGTLGEVYYIAEDCWPLNTALYVKDFKGNRPRFIYYYLQSILKGMQSDKAAVPGVNRNDLHARKVKFVADYSIQENIENLIIPYDDLIENNRRRIQLLEESARLLYKEWFVQLRFPGHEHVKIIDGVPEGWDKKKLDKLCYQVKVSVDPSEVEVDTPYIGLEHIPRRSITLSEWETAEKVTSGKYSYQEGDIIFGKIRPYFHKVGFALTSGITSSDAIVIRPHEAEHYAYLLMLISSDLFVALASKTVKEGSKMPRADWTFLSQQYFLIPSGSLLEVFQEQIEAIVKQLKVLAFQNKQLAQARDILLPRLMNGALAV